MASIPKPARKSEPPKPDETVGNLDKAPPGESVPLQLKISAALRKEFRGYAFDRDRDANNLFEEVWAFYKQHHG